MAGQGNEVKASVAPADRKQVGIEYMQRRIGAVHNPGMGIDSKESVKAEIAELMAKGWELFQVFSLGEQGAGTIGILHVFVLYA